MKKVRTIERNAELHWVGDGFPVRTLFSYHDRPEQFSPFLLLDYAAAYSFAPGEAPRGVGEHPHRGFETVTIAYQGELAHRDSAGNSGTIRAGDVQWMTAASGVLHEEFHSQAFTRRGGPFEMVQLWVNLPANKKMSPPRYQELHNEQIPRVELADASTVRVIAGTFQGAEGPAKTFTPIHLWDLQWSAGFSTRLSVPEGFTTLLLVQQGKLVANDSQSAGPSELVVFDRQGDTVALAAVEDSRALLLCGQPIDEPVVGQGPFVMNTRDEIMQAFADYQHGRMGRLA